VNPSTTTRALSLTVQRQEKSEWCWAAVSASVDRFFRPDSAHTQCEIAFEQFSNKGGYRDGRGVWFASFLVANEAVS
jgi:hypothetical protein